MLSTIAELGTPAPILVFDADDRFSVTLLEIIKPYGFSVDAVYNKSSLLRACKKGNYKVVFIDLKTAGTRSLDLVQRIKRMLPFIQPVIVFGWGSETGFNFSLNNNVFDFVRKPVDPEQIVFTIKNAADLSDLKRERWLLLKNAKEQFEIIGQSRPVLEIKNLIEKTWNSCINVLIIGDQGTGKELIANSIHMNSARAAMPFMHIDVKNENFRSLEKILFGSIDEINGLNQGVFSQAEHGTVYLSNIDKMDLKTQAKLLSLIEQGIVEVEGGTLSLGRDTRIIASSETGLEEAVLKGKFRRELLYRLNVINIKIPPLRDRKDDIPLLFDYFSNKFSKMYDCSGKTITPGVMKIIRDYDWPGNVGELRNFTARLFLFFKEEIRPEHADLLLKNWEWL
ncbi:sigma-54-dependent Fis family transcriptional regulator [bacterium]|nr:sigma-54-dependent Fis family transcriptional regulator [bacterium]